MDPRPQKKWFKRKLYGYGWTPSSWQGWLTLTIYLGINILNFLRIDSSSHSVSDTLVNFIPTLIFTTLILFYLCIVKGEKARWQWGKRLDD